MSTSSASRSREDLIHRLRERARIRRQISTRKSVQEGAPDRIADLLEEAASALSEIGATDVVKLIQAVRYVDAFFPKDGNTKIWEQENSEAIAIARGNRAWQASHAERLD